MEKKIVITRLKGGLGNQMFQYAFGKAMALRSNSSLSIDVSFLKQNNQTKGVFVAREYELGIFSNIDARVLEFEKLYENRILKKLKRSIFHPGLKEVTETSLAFDAAYMQLTPPLLYDGYWQHQDYFREYSRDIRLDFQFPSISAGDSAYAFYNSIKQTAISIGVHIRRGDYLNDLILQHHGWCSRSYYENAFRQMNERYPGASYYFFSDDPPWVKSEMATKVERFEVIEGNIGSESWKDLYLMSCCTHQVIANSSFSWWAAWLNLNESKTVISPTNWFANPVLNEQAKEVCPPSWIRIENH